MFMCIVVSCVVGRRRLLWPVHSLGKTLLAFVLLHIVLQGQICLLLQESLDFLLLHSSPLWWKEKAMAPHSSTLARKIPWAEEPGRLQSMGSQGVGHDWATSLSCIGEGNGNPLQCSCLENPRDGGAWWAAMYGVAQSRTRLERLSSSSMVYYTSFIYFSVNSKLLYR